ncbi:MAG: sigma-54 dependent transcriptional regulator [Gemmatimonadetes bacterium]|nr:sigma-54 dependent transcriptional regulator [Gemmatimonadota bacterium]
MSRDFVSFVGRSKVMRGVYHQIQAFASAPIPVLITGESGTGKELAAQALRELAGGGGPFEVTNCAELPETLIDSELFGHVKGAFTGAIKNHHGVVRRADGGVLFLDEIAELPVYSQAKLLRCIETGRFRPVGGERVRQSRFRLVAATNRDLELLVDQGEFREDLRYRLGAATIHMPALRDRGEDVTLLAEFFLRRYVARSSASGPSGFDEDAVAWLMHYDWPGNVRELRNGVETAAAITSGPLITAVVLRDVLHQESTLLSRVPTLEAALAKAERRAIETALRATRGNRERAAQLLHVSPATLYRKLAAMRTEEFERTLDVRNGKKSETARAAKKDGANGHVAKRPRGLDARPAGSEPREPAPRGSV